MQAPIKSKQTAKTRLAGMLPIQTRSATVIVPPDDRTPRTSPRKLVLCFDGTGNQYKGDGTETNVLRIFRLLDKDAADHVECTCISQSHFVQESAGLLCHSHGKHERPAEL